MGKKKEDTYEWIKRRSKQLFTKVSSWQNEDTEIAYEKQGVWPIKKLLAIEWYIRPFTIIAKGKKSPFEKWNYIDLFAGSGLVKISETEFKKTYLYPGTALLPLFSAKENKFTDYYFFDSDPTNIEALNRRIDRLKGDLPPDLTIHPPESLPFGESIIMLFGPNGIISENSLSLVIIDPEGIQQVKWDLLKLVLGSRRRLDVILTVMTWSLAFNHSNARKDHKSEYAKTITEFFGDKEWQNIQDSKGLIEYYCSKIQRLGYRTETIKVGRKGESKLYDLILVTKK